MRLLRMADPLSEPDLHRELVVLLGENRASAFAFRITAETKSTNDDAKVLGREGAPEGTVILTDHQTAGRGRRDNRWLSPPGTNLLFSVLLRPPPGIPFEHWGRIPLLAGLATARGIESCFPGELPPVRLKWPNDLFLGGRKLGGILVESQWSGDRGGADSFCVAGVGINVNLPSAELPGELPEPAASLHSHTRRIVSRCRLLAHILAEWSAVYPASLEDFEHSRAALDRRSYLAGHGVEILRGGETIRGTAGAIGPAGELIVTDPDGAPVEVRAADRVRRLGQSGEPEK